MGVRRSESRDWCLGVLCAAAIVACFSAFTGRYGEGNEGIFDLRRHAFASGCECEAEGVLEEEAASEAQTRREARGWSEKEGEKDRELEILRVDGNPEAFVDLRFVTKEGDPMWVRGVTLFRFDGKWFKDISVRARGLRIPVAKKQGDCDLQEGQRYFVRNAGREHAFEVPKIEGGVIPSVKVVASSGEASSGVEPPGPPKMTINGTIRGIGLKPEEDRILVRYGPAKGRMRRAVAVNPDGSFKLSVDALGGEILVGVARQTVCSAYVRKCTRTQVDVSAAADWLPKPGDVIECRIHYDAGDEKRAPRGGAFGFYTDADARLPVFWAGVSSETDTVSARVLPGEWFVRLMVPPKGEELPLGKVTIKMGQKEIVVGPPIEEEAGKQDEVKKENPGDGL